MGLRIVGAMRIIRCSVFCWFIDVVVAGSVVAAARAITATTTSEDDDCAGRRGVFFFHAERCYNTTHIIEQSGSCANGLSELESVIFKACSRSSSDSETTRTTAAGYCHECSNSQLVCSNSDDISTACDERHYDGICNDEQQPTTTTKNQNSYALHWGCATQHTFFRTSQVCSSSSSSSSSTSGQQAQQQQQQQHTQSTCEQMHPTYSYCLACPGTQLCVSDEHETCHSLNLTDGLSHNAISKPKAPTTDDTTTTGGGGDTNKQEEEEEKSTIDSVFYLPLDPRDNDFACDSFRSDVNFYREDCYNSSHGMVVSGSCIDGTLKYGSRAISHCRNSPGGNNKGELVYCHKCRNKLVCSSSTERNAVCDSALSESPLCPATVDDMSLPMISSSFTGCSNETNFYYSYEFCTRESKNSDVIRSFYDTQNSPCSQSNPHLTMCAECRDGIQLCANDDKEDSSSPCGVHNYQTEIANLDPPLDCQSVTSDIDFYQERCYNSTHTVIWSGQCMDGTLVHAKATMNGCVDSGIGQQYCHECSHSHLVCSESKNSNEACSMDPVVEEEATESDEDSELCKDSLNRTSSFGLCVDAETFRYGVVSCTEGNLGVETTSNKCGTTFEGFPYCASCGSYQICSADPKTCDQLGINSSSSPKETDEETPNDSNEDTNTGRNSTDPASGGSSDDDIKCGSVNANINYYVEECFNHTHVKLSRGECENGVKTNRQTILQSCSEYGDDPARRFCYMCGHNVFCSSSSSSSSSTRSSSSPCNDTLSLKDVNAGRQADDDLPSCDESDNHLGGSFGCLDDDIFLTMFQTCHEGRFAAERSAYRCSESFPGYHYCKTCGNVNICSVQKRSSCQAMGFPSLD